MHACRDHSLRPGVEIDPGEFSFEEEVDFAREHSSVGNCWAKISRLFPGRSENNMKNKW